MAFPHRHILRTLFLPAAAIVLALGCRASEVPKFPLADTPEASSAAAWEKPRVSVRPTEPRANLVVRLYEVRHEALREMREKVGLRSVLEPLTAEPPSWPDDIFIHRIKPGDDFLSRLALWSRAESHPVSPVKTLEISSEPGSDEFVWEAAPTDRKPSFGGLSFSAERQEDGRVRLHVYDLPARRPSGVESNAIPGMDPNFYSIHDIASDEIVAVGGLTISRSMAPELERKRFRSVTVAQETVELLAIVSVVPRTDGDAARESPTKPGDPKP